MKSLKLNGLYGMAGFVMTAIALFLFYPLLLRLLGENYFGIYILAMGFPNMIALFGIGLFSATTHYTAKSYADGRFRDLVHVSIASISMYLLIGIIASITIWTVAGHLCSIINIPAEAFSAAQHAFRMAGVMVPFVLLAGVVSSVYKGLGDFFLPMITVVAQAWLANGLPILASLFYPHIALIQTMALSVSGSVLVSLMALVALYVRLKKMVGKDGVGLPGLGLYRKMFMYGVQMVGATVISMLAVQLPRYLVSAWFGPAGVSVYTIAFSLSSKIQAAVNSVAEIIFPYVSGQKNKAAIEWVFARMLLASSLIALPGMFVLVLYPEAILTLWVGEGMAKKASELLVYFSIASFIASIASTPYHLFNGLGLPLKNVKVSVAYALVLLLSLFVLTGLMPDRLTVFGMAFVVTNSFMLASYLWITINVLNKQSLGVQK